MRAPAAAIALAAVAAAGCHRAPASQRALGARREAAGTAAAAPAPREALAIAVYAARERSYAVVDDRRAIEVTGPVIQLDRIARDASLAELTLEVLAPLGAQAGAAGATAAAGAGTAGTAAAAAAGTAGTAAAAPLAPLVFGRCVRPQLAAGDDEPGVASPLVECAVTGPPGRYLVRVHYATASIAASPRHHVALIAADRARVATRFLVPTLAWGARAELAIYDGAPGAGAAPRERARGSVACDGSTAILAPPPRDVPARLVHVFDGMRRGGATDPTAPAWGRDSRRDVRAVLELDGAALAPAPADVRIELGGEPHELVTAYAPGAPGAPAPAPSAATQRIPLWIEPALRGVRVRTSQPGAPAAGRDPGLAERLELAIANTGGEPREVWLEEPLRPARAPTIARAHPSPPALARGVARAKLRVEPGATARLGYTLVYRGEQAPAYRGE